MTTRLLRLSKIIGFPLGPRRIGPVEGFPSLSLMSLRISAKVSITGTGLAASRVFGSVVNLCQIDCVI